MLIEGITLIEFGLNFLSSQGMPPQGMKSLLYSIKFSSNYRHTPTHEHCKKIETESKCCLLSNGILKQAVRKYNNIYNIFTKGVQKSKS
jgi:hypothetical protein